MSDKQSDRILQLTEDGSHTLFVPALNEHYHSVHGAIQESKHVFIDAGLNQCSKQSIAVFEVGFGTGLNALLTAGYAQSHDIQIDYVSIEAYPLDMTLVNQLNYAKEDEQSLFETIHRSDWGTKQQMTDHFTLTKIEADFTDFAFDPFKATFDIIYFDAFAPDIQAPMWSQQLFDAMFNIAAADAILTTYCAKGEVRRRMQAAGFMVERIPGPPGKREMLRARKK